MGVEIDEVQVRGSQLAPANAVALVEDAQILAKAGRFGRAAALLVLAGEESAKAVTLHWAAFSKDDKRVHWRDVFVTHEAKQGTMALSSVFFALNQSLIPLMRELLSVFGPKFEAGNSPDEFEIKKWLEHKFTTSELVQEIEKARDKAVEESGWWHLSADELKKRGFYVEHVPPGDWHSPLGVSDAEYHLVRGKVVDQIQWIKSWLVEPRAIAESDPEKWELVISSLFGMMGIMWLTKSRKERMAMIKDAKKSP